MMDIDPAYEYNAPQYVDFNCLDESFTSEHEKYFGMYVYIIYLTYGSLSSLDRATSVSGQFKICKMIFDLDIWHVGSLLHCQACRSRA